MTGREHEGVLWQELLCLHLGSDNTGGKNVCVNFHGTECLRFRYFIYVIPRKCFTGFKVCCCIHAVAVLRLSPSLSVFCYWFLSPGYDFIAENIFCPHGYIKKMLQYIVASLIYSESLRNHLNLEGWHNIFLKLENLFYGRSFSYNCTEKEFLNITEAVGSCLGEVGPVDFSTIALQHSGDTSSTKAPELFEDKELQWTFITLTYLNNTLVEDWWVWNGPVCLLAPASSDIQGNWYFTWINISWN